jgi:hypothetical protein
MLGRIVKATGSVTYDTPESAAAAGEAARPAIVEDVGPGDVPADEGGAPTYVQLTDIDALAGKTLERVEIYLWDQLFLVFTDGTFATFNTVHEYDDSCTIVIAYKTDFSDRVRLGLVSPEDIAAHEESERQKKADVIAAKAAQERAEYERLRAKFEDRLR